MNPTITVMLVDDHAVVRAGYRAALHDPTGRISVVREADRGEEACQYYAECKPDVVVMDLSMPGIGGLAAIRHIRARDPKARILAFSMHDETAYAERALAAGAVGYITKSCAPDILVEAVQAIARGETYIEPEIAERLALHKPEGPVAQILAPREFDVFLLLAKGRTPREVGDELHLAEKTVSNYCTQIKSKLGVKTSAEMARLAYQQGLFKD